MLSTSKFGEKLTHAARLTTNQSELNKLLPGDRTAHDWYRFVLSFPPQIVRQYLERFDVQPDQRVLDPFCGTGTTLVECKKLGIPSIGIEANPVGYFASRVKTHWRPVSQALLAHAEEVAGRALTTLKSAGIEDNPVLFPLDLPVKLETLSSECQKLLLTNSISPLPLHKTLVLLSALERDLYNPYAEYERLALAKALVTSISNLHFGPEVGVGPIKPDASVIGVWLETVRSMADDLELLHPKQAIQSSVFQTDARRLLGVLGPGSIDVVITSPPYPNEKDYTRTTRLETVLLSFVKNKADLQALKRTLLRSNTRGVYKGDDDDQWVKQFPSIQRLAETIEARRIELGKTSGFERLYSTVTRLYFGGMARHLAELRPALRPGAQLAYVVGDQASYLQVMIRTGQHLAEIAETLGYECTGIDLFRTRFATATKQQLREEIVLLRWPG